MERIIDFKVRVKQVQTLLWTHNQDKNIVNVGVLSKSETWINTRLWFQLAMFDDPNWFVIDTFH